MKLKIIEQNNPRWKAFRWITLSLLLTIGIVVGIWAGYTYQNDWTGFNEYQPTAGDFERSKTLWDWLDLIIIPAILTGGVLWFNWREKIRENAQKEAAETRETENRKEHIQEETLKIYFDTMTNLLLNSRLREKLNRMTADTKRVPIVVDVARVHTVTALRRMNKERRKEVWSFLQDANMLKGEKSILQGARMSDIDLSGDQLMLASLREAVLVDANLSKAKLFEVDLSDAWLDYANLSGVWFNEVDLSNSHLNWANLSGTTFIGIHETNLSEADLRHAKLDNANLSGVNLKGANLCWSKLRGADLCGVNLRGANLSAGNMFEWVRRGDDLSQVDWRSVIVASAILATDSDQHGFERFTANLTSADLSGSDLTGAHVTVEQLKSAKSLEGATMPDGRKFSPEWFDM